MLKVLTVLQARMSSNQRKTADEQSQLCYELFKLRMKWIMNRTPCSDYIDATAYVSVSNEVELQLETHKRQFTVFRIL